MSLIYLDIDPELAEDLAVQQISLNDVLAQANLDATVSHGVLPETDGQPSRSKDLVPIIMAGATSVSMVVMALSYAFRQWARRPHMVEVEELEEVRDAKGNVLLDASGKPLYKRTKRWQILEPQKANSNTDLEFKAGVSGVVLKLGIAESQHDHPAASQSE